MKITLKVKGGIIVSLILVGLFLIFTNVNAGGRGINYIDRTLPENKEISEEDKTKPQISATKITNTENQDEKDLKEKRDWFKYFKTAQATSTESRISTEALFFLVVIFAIAGWVWWSGRSKK